MCSQTCTAIFFFVVFRLCSFAGDGLMFYKYITELFRFYILTVNSPSVASSEYCDIPIEGNFSTEQLDLDVIRDDILYSLIAYGITSVFALMLTPPLIKFMTPKTSEVYGDEDDEDDHSIDYDFRLTEKGGRRTLRYVATILLVFLHDIPTCALGTSIFASIVAPDGPRCIECLFVNQRICQETEIHRGWDPEIVFPRAEDYYWLGLLGGKVLGTIGCIGSVMFFELQYRYQIRELSFQRRRQLLRRHFGQVRKESGRRQKYCLIWLVAFVMTYILMALAVFMMLGPTLAVIQFRMDLFLVPQIEEVLTYTTYASWGAWGLGLIGIMATTCGFAFCRNCCSEDD